MHGLRTCCIDMAIVLHYLHRISVCKNRMKGVMQNDTLRVTCCVASDAMLFAHCMCTALRWAASQLTLVTALCFANTPMRP